MDKLQQGPRPRVKENLLTDIKSFLLMHQNEFVLRMQGERTFRPDCATIANLSIKKILEKFEKRLVQVGTISVDEKNRIKKFGQKGFTNHVINYVEFFDGSFLAFDLTAKYNLNEVDGPIKYFQATSINDLKQKLGDFYGTTRRWTINNE